MAGAKFGAFSIDQRIGVEGVVERDRAWSDQGWVLLSRVRRSAPAGARKDLLTAARIAREVDDPHVVPLVACGSVQGVAFFAHAHAPGTDLRALYNAAFRRKRSLPLWVSVQLAADAARGAGRAARRAEVPHAEISPRYVAIDGHGYGRVADFAVARALHDAAGGPSVTGRYSYRAPEQIRRGDADPRTDVFSMGVLLFEMTTGTRLFKRRDAEATRDAVLGGEVRAPSRVLPGYPDALERIVLDALDPEPSRRPDDGEVLAGELERFLDRGGLAVPRSRIAAFVRELVPDVDEAWPEPGRAEPRTGRRRRISDRPALSVFDRGAAPGAASDAAGLADTEPTGGSPSVAPQPSAPLGSDDMEPVEAADGGQLPVPEAIDEPEAPALDPDPTDPARAPSDPEGDAAPAAGPRSEGSIARIPLSTGNEAVEPRLVDTDRVRKRPKPKRKTQRPSSRSPGGRAARRERTRGAWGILAVAALAVLGWALAPELAPNAPDASANAPASGAEAERPRATEHPPESSVAGSTSEHDAPSLRAREGGAGSVRPEPPPRGTPGRVEGAGAPPPAGAPRGTLKLVVRPWGRVRVDGWDYGLTPLPELELAPGSHRVVVENEDLGLAWSGQVEVVQGERAVVEARLR